MYPKGQRGFSTRLAHCSGGPPSAALLATSAPGRLLSTGLLSVLYFDGKVLVVGGENGTSPYLASAELY